MNSDEWKSNCGRKRCIFPECDELGSLSMCYKSGVPCPEKHAFVQNDLICNRLNMQCCRSICAGPNTSCHLKNRNCPKNYIETAGNWSCPLPDYKCCSKIS
ncbi:hypothetical protein HZS_7697 [Henneguya salminicola]|nr:hypothetical protein HZS_7697 [Henneguya salminicola]